VTEQLLPQQLESPSGTGRDEPRHDHQPDSPRQNRTGCQPADLILTGSYGSSSGFVPRHKPNGRFQVVVATSSLNRSAGVSHSRVMRGRPLSRLAKRSRSSWL
jgi:hypothetical protein